LEGTKSQTTSQAGQLPIQNVHAWVQYLPDGAVSVDIEGATLILRASNTLQERFETLFDKRKVGTLSLDENREYQAICDLDTALSWLNRLTRESRNR
jgi:hypothetical protein